MAGNKQVVDQRVGVAIGGTLPVVAVHLADGGVQIHGHRPITGARPSRPRPGKELLGELADVPKVTTRKKVPRWRAP
jgi:hypothetical protein